MRPPVPRSSRPLLFLLAAAAALALALPLAGCGSGGSGTTDSSAGGGAKGESKAADKGTVVGARSAANLSPKALVEERKPSKLDAAAPTASWPHFGRVPQRTHYLGSPIRDLDPPFKVLWHINSHALIEFPPAVYGGVAYLVNKYGNVLAVRLADKEILWRRTVRKRLHGPPVDVTGPAYYDGRVYVAEIGGGLFALDAKSGRVVWKRDLGAHLESSPLIVGKTLYIGTDSKQLLAIDAADGHVRWRFEAPAAIKSSPSYDAGRVYVGDYESAMFAVDAKTGREVWRTNTSTEAPFGEGGFYSSPAIAFGRVFAARDDGTVFAFEQRSGKVDWSFPTGGAVYGSPAVAKVPGTPPTVYIGSENGRLFALAVEGGKERWHREVGGPVPGTASVIGDTVFTSSFETRKSVGFDVHTHERDFALPSAGYSPVVSDGQRLYVAGYYTLYALEPIGTGKSQR
jgi:outer membrane protein assembly factor BamB